MNIEARHVEKLERGAAYVNGYVGRIYYFVGVDPAGDSCVYYEYVPSFDDVEGFWFSGTFDASQAAMIKSCTREATPIELNEAMSAPSAPSKIARASESTPHVKRYVLVGGVTKMFESTGKSLGRVELDVIGHADTHEECVAETERDRLLRGSGRCLRMTLWIDTTTGLPGIPEAS
jgi:hypothetical protein